LGLELRPQGVPKNQSAQKPVIIIFLRQHGLQRKNFLALPRNYRSPVAPVLVADGFGQGDPA
jgi:hypothetical protein